ncbi:hypothetical protein [Nisaea sp.]|uniref:hypothetical protein n=1 Tax=Nisaea sp. TaxID=2024842 RepID=UPI00329A41D5
MANSDSNTKTDDSPGALIPPKISNKNDRTHSIFSIAGYIFLLLSAALFGFSIYETATSIELDSKFYFREENEQQLQWLLRVYGNAIFNIIAAIFAYVFGKSLLKSAGATSAPVIPDRDRQLLEPLVTKPNAEAIDQYIRLASLGGFTGTFQKLGFSGLPLATITLTVIFALLASFENETEHFIDLTKLTLGAFIGSFVQREAAGSRPFQRIDRRDDRLPE